MHDRIAILSDIHGNLEALLAVLRDIDENEISRAFHLGDIIGYGEAGAACLQTIRDRNITGVQGNHDANILPPRNPDMRDSALEVLAREATRLTDEEMNYLHSLPANRVIDDHFILVHGALTGRDDYILNAAAVKENRQLMRTTYQGLHICFFGHTHLPMVIQGNSADMKFQAGRTVELDDYATYLINPGSVGQPRDKCPLASYAIYSPQEALVEIRRIEYPVAAEQERMRAAGLPEKLARRLELGR